MSGRPTIYKQTLTGNFPAGVNPWNGQPLAVQPAGTWFTPDTKPPAEEFNWLLGTIGVQQQSILDWCGSQAAQNWRVPQGGASASNISNTGFTLDTTNCVTYDTLNARWLIAGRDIGTDAIPVIQTDDGCSTFTLCGTAKSYSGVTAHKFKPLALMASPVTQGLKLLFSSDDGTPTNGSVFTSTDDGAFASTSGTGVDATDGHFLWNGSLYILVVGVSTTPKILTSPTGATWTNRTIPAGVTSATSWSCCQNGVRSFAFSQTASLTKFAYSDDGITWSEGTIGLASGEAVSACAVVDTAAGPAIVVTTTISGLSNIWRSTDNGGTWTQIRTSFHMSTAASVGAASLPTEMSSIGSLLVAVGQGGALRLAYSNDAGTTWYTIQSGIGTNRGSSDKGYTYPRVSASPVGFFWLNSLWCSMSYEQGLAKTLPVI